MVLSIGFHRVLRSQTISKGQPAQEPLVSQILWKIRKTPQAPEDRSCPNRILKNKGKNAWNWLRFLRTIMRKRTKGCFQNVLLRWLKPLIPPFAAPVHVHTYTHTDTHTYTQTPSLHPPWWLGQCHRRGRLVAELEKLGSLEILQGVRGAAPGSGVGRSYSPPSCKVGAPCVPEGGGLGDVASPIGGERQPALCQVPAS